MIPAVGGTPISGIVMAVALTACGRVDFDASGSAGSAGSADAMPADVRATTPLDAFFPPVEPITLVQSNGATNFATSITAPFDEDVLAGDTIVVAVDIMPAEPIASVTDELGNSFAVAQPLTSGADAQLAVYYGHIDTGGRDAVTMIFGGTTTSELRIHEFTGIATTNPYDTGGLTAGTAPMTPVEISGTPVTTSEADEMVFGFELASTADTGPGFDLALSFDDDITEFAIAPNPGNYAITAQLTGVTTNQGWELMAAVFRAQPQ
jgi:hypothetical protein